MLREDRADGSIILRSRYEIGPVARCTGDWLDLWAAEAPDRVFLAERAGAGWREVTYGVALQHVKAIARHLLARDLGPERPIMILSGNGVDHGLLTLAAQYVGIPTVPVAEQYSLIPAAHARLSYAARLTTPGLVFAADGGQYADALALDVFAGVEKLTSAAGPVGTTPFADLLVETSTDIGPAAAAVGPETLAKVLFTSGSTSDPKGVLTTQRMLTTNQAQIATCLPFLRERPPCIVDWLPWNHTFGGSYNFNLMLANGGSLYIDDGKPAPGLMDRTLENLALKSATISFNVPVGFAQLVAAMEADAALRETYFANLDMIFYAGASLPRATWDALAQMAREIGGKTPLITTSWGLTETAPGAMLSHQQSDDPSVIGVPMPALDVKLVPVDVNRFDVRVRGDSITKGYLRNAAKTQEAFDDEGFFLTDDAMGFVDPSDVSKGMAFDGRLSEDFKLSSGTWVQTAALRLSLLGALAPFAQDAVITGADRDALGVLIIPNRAAITARGWHVREQDGLLRSASLEQALTTQLAAHAAAATGSATRISRALVLANPPVMAEGEATAKGNINFPGFLPPARTWLSVFMVRMATG
ncbi:AMP-binding protein [Sulfitobacter aestuariivivens]|uniref:AMP-binding protein n=1 Tax=Sulfitobacter aestuariivivens TaxID=2766981 RepID=UPI003622BFD6